MASTEALAGPESASFDAQAQSRVEVAVADLNALAGIAPADIAEPARVMAKDIHELAQMAASDPDASEASTLTHAREVSQEYVAMQAALAQAVQQTCGS